MPSVTRKLIQDIKLAINSDCFLLQVGTLMIYGRRATATVRQRSTGGGQRKQYRKSDWFGKKNDAIQNYRTTEMENTINRLIVPLYLQHTRTSVSNRQSAWNDAIPYPSLLLLLEHRVAFFLNIRTSSLVSSFAMLIHQYRK